MSKDTYRNLAKLADSGDEQTKKCLEAEDGDGIGLLFADIEHAIYLLKNADGSEEEGWTVHLGDDDREIILNALNDYRVLRERRGAPIGARAFEGRQLRLHGA